MSNDIIDKPIVLSLNRVWQAIGHRTVRQALVALMGGDSGHAPALGLDIVYPQRDDGSWDFERPLQMVPVSWKDWLTLPVRSFDFVVNTPSRAVRVPTVIVSTQFAKMPAHLPRLSRDAIFQRDGGICQYTGEFVGRDGGNLDHVIPRDAGGRNSFDNLVWAKREINTHKANRLPHEAGLRLIRQPKAPRPLPASALIRDPKHPDWRHFLS